MDSSSTRRRRRAGRVCTALCLLLLAACLTAPRLAASAAITDYTTQSVTSSELDTLPTDHWGQYTTLCGAAGNTQLIPLKDSLNRIFVNITLASARFPFYAWDGTRWYVSSMGFLSPTPYGMCNGYCPQPFFANISGSYAFSDNTSNEDGEGGDWPMIALYTVPFEMLSITASQSYISAQDYSVTVGSTTESYTVVEYCNVPVLNQTASSSTQLTAQAVVFANGTVILRYASVPDASVVAAYLPSTGLIYSKTLRKVVAAPSATNGIAAYRFDPVVDACGAHTSSSSACTADTGNSCAWCASTSACTTRAFVAQVCPSGQWTPPGTGGGSSSSSAGSQPYYSVSVDYNTPFDTITNYAYTSDLRYNNFTLRLANARWNIPLFATPSISSLSCIPGATCPTQNSTFDCRWLSNTCVNGNYTFSILALESQFVFAQAAVWIARLLGVRANGDELCYESGDCSNGVVGQLTGAAYINGYSAMPLFSVQLYGDRKGVIDVVIQCGSCVAGDPMPTFPPMRVGLVRYGVDDPASVMVPQGLLRSGLHVRFVPTGIPNCGLNGVYNQVTGQCACKPGYFGSDCTACPVCWTGSTCDDGIAGSGQCLCPGGTCASVCSNVSSTTLLGHTCGGCDVEGGRCECGQCVCQPGWSGTGCSVPPVDACFAYSFDGCEVCGQHPGCVFCFDSTCFNPALSNRSTGYTCSYSTPADNVAACTTYGSRGLRPEPTTTYDVVAAICLSIALALSLGLLIGFLWNICAKRTVRNPAEMLAVIGSPDFQNPHRQREVIQVNFARRRVADRGIMGIPLRQVRLDRLFQRRKAELLTAQQ